MHFSIGSRRRELATSQSYSFETSPTLQPTASANKLSFSHHACWAKRKADANNSNFFCCLLMMHLKHETAQQLRQVSAASFETVREWELTRFISALGWCTHRLWRWLMKWEPICIVKPVALLKVALGTYLHAHLSLLLSSIIVAELHHIIHRELVEFDFEIFCI